MIEERKSEDKRTFLQPQECKQVTPITVLPPHYGYLPVIQEKTDRSINLSLAIVGSFIVLAGGILIGLIWGIDKENSIHMKSDLGSIKKQIESSNESLRKLKKTGPYLERKITKVRSELEELERKNQFHIEKNTEALNQNNSHLSRIEQRLHQLQTKAAKQQVRREGQIENSQ